MGSPRWPLLFVFAFVLAAGCGSGRGLPLDGSGAAGGAGLGGHGGAGLGGASGSGAGGLGGASGSGAGGLGGGADSGETCQQLMADYTSALVPAIACVVGPAEQCQQLTLSLDCTACYRGVQDATTVNAIRAQMVAQSCIHPVVCPCSGSGTGTCVATDAGSTSGTCANGL
jgi:hypothetical protein